jgi:cytosine/adenosine deaminase-related metal-dependent hydrolase
MIFAPTPAAQRTTLRADFLFPGNGDVLRDALLVVEGERIVECRAAAATSADINLGNAAIIPPLVNAHTHLEFSNRDQPVAAGANFAEWLTAVMAERSALRQLDPNSLAAVRRGLDQTRRFGCLHVGEIATTAGDSVSQLEGPVGGVQFLELLGATPDRIAQQLEIAREFLQLRQRVAPGRFRPALSPHAPYSTAMPLVEGAVALARDFNVPIAMHLAETQEEMQLLATQQGPLAEFLIERKIWPPSHLAPNTYVMDYLQVLAQAPRALVIHGNYLSAKERAFIANRSQMSIVYCPRTHAYFGHPQYPLAETLAAGARVALGTDSCASNPDLNIWAEAQFVARKHPAVLPAKLLELVTTSAAEAIGDRPPRLEAGQLASFAVIAGLTSAPSTGHDPFAALLATSTYPAKVWLRGREILLD